MSNSLISIKPLKIKPLRIYGSQRSNKRTLSTRHKHILYDNAKGKCKGCGKKISFSEMQVGHKIAYSKGGAATLANSVCLCYSCNRKQGTDSFKTFKKKLAGTHGKRTKTVKRRKRQKRRGPLDFNF